MVTYVGNRHPIQINFNVNIILILIPNRLEIVNKYKSPFLILVVVMFIFGCVRPFSPPEVNSQQSYLVVDGFLNTGSDTSVFLLSRTQNINQNDNPLIESGATVIVEKESGETSSFTEITNGKYILPPAQFDPARKYRLKIKTSNGSEYVSEFVIVTKTPPIDSITYKIEPVRNSVVFYANAHDAKNQTHFYRWKLEETWEYKATYASVLEVVDGKIILRNEDINTCWRTNRSANIILGSTIKQTNDIIKDLPVNIVPISTNKLYLKYSMMLKQYALSQEAFEYWTALSKTTQLTGSLFDPQPYLLTGNIKNTTNPEELVFGYFSASTEERKRIVIRPGLGSFPRCTEPDTITVQCGSLDVDCAYRTQKLLLNYYGKSSEFVTVANPECADCRVQGGTTKRPAFME